MGIEFPTALFNFSVSCCLSLCATSQAAGSDTFEHQWARIAFARHSVLCQRKELIRKPDSALSCSLWWWRKKPTVLYTYVILVAGSIYSSSPVVWDSHQCLEGGCYLFVQVMESVQASQPRILRQTQLRCRKRIEDGLQQTFVSRKGKQALRHSFLWQLAANEPCNVVSCYCHNANKILMSCYSRLC